MSSNRRKVPATPSDVCMKCYLSGRETGRERGEFLEAPGVKLLILIFVSRCVRWVVRADC